MVFDDLSAEHKANARAGGLVVKKGTKRLG